MPRLATLYLLHAVRSHLHAPPAAPFAAPASACGRSQEPVPATLLRARAWSDACLLIRRYVGDDWNASGLICAPEVLYRATFFISETSTRNTGCGGLLVRARAQTLGKWPVMPPSHAGLRAQARRLASGLVAGCSLCSGDPVVTRRVRLRPQEQRRRSDKLAGWQRRSTPRRVPRALVQL